MLKTRLITQRQGFRFFEPSKALKTRYFAFQVDQVSKRLQKYYKIINVPVFGLFGDSNKHSQTGCPRLKDR